MKCWERIPTSHPILEKVVLFLPIFVICVFIIPVCLWYMCEVGVAMEGGGAGIIPEGWKLESMPDRESPVKVHQSVYVLANVA